MQMRSLSIAGLAMALGLALFGVAHAQTLIGSYVRLEGQVTGPPNSPTLNSTHDASAGDIVKWYQYFQSRQPGPWQADAEQTVPSGHRWEAGSLRMPPNTTARWKVDSTWNASEPTGGMNLTAVGWHTDPMLKIDFSTTEKSTDFSGTGDGFRVIPYKKNFFVVNHHADSNVVRPLNCRTATTGANCPGFPADAKGLTFTDQAGVALGTTTTWRSYTPHSPMDALNYETGELFVGVNAAGGTYVVCTNLDTLKSCGAWLLGASPGGLDERNVNFETFGSKYYVLDNKGSLFCFDYVLKQTCGTTVYNLFETPGSMHNYTSTQLDGKMFFTGVTRMWCHDPQTGAPCAGWNGANGWPMGDKGGVIPIPDTIGAPYGVCATNPNHCRTVAGTPFTLSTNAKNFVIGNRSWLSDFGGWNSPIIYSMNFNAVHGSRIFMPRSNGFGLNCFDFSKDAVCQDFPQLTSQWDRAYTVRFDPTRPDCLLMLGDAAIAYQLNVTTLGACSDSGSATDPKILKVTPADHYRCDPAAAQVTGWDKIRVSQSMSWGGLTGLSQIKVTLRDASGVLLPGSLNPNRTFASGSFALDISDVPYETYPTLTINFQMSSAGNLYSTGPVGVDVTWKGPPRQVCFMTRVPSPATCEAGSRLTVTTGAAHAASVALETIVADKVMWSGAGSDGHAAAAAATSTRALSGGLASGESRTFVLQGRYALKAFSGDLWSMGLTDTLKLDVDALTKLSSSVTASSAPTRRMYLSKPVVPGDPGSMAMVLLDYANAAAGQRAALDIGLTGLYDGKGTARIGYLQGTDGTSGFRTRPGGPLGPVINSAPTVIPERAIAGLSEANHPGYAVYRRDVSRSEPMVIWGGNDGAIHAASVGAAGLKETWSLVPDSMVRQAARYSDATLAEVRRRPYFVDAQPMVGHANIGNGGGIDWRTVAVVPFGRGGRGITAIDVTKTDVSAGKGVLFEYSNTTHADLADLGYIVSPPILSEAMGSHQIVKLSDGRWAVLVGNGVDSNDTSGGEAASGPGRPVLYAFYLDSALPRWRRFAVDGLLGTSNDAALSTNNGLSTPRPVDTDGDGRADIVYAGDVKGNLWRFDLKNLSAPAVTKLYAGGAERPIHTAPLAVRNSGAGACPPAQVGGCWQVIVGSGAYLSPLIGTTNTDTQQLVGILDLGKGATVSDASLVTQPYSASANAAGIDFRIAEGASIDYVGGKRGWKMALGAKEHAVSPPLLQPNGQLRLTTVRPIVAGSSPTSCQPARSWLFEASPVFGPPTADTFDFSNDGNVNDQDRVKIGSGDTKRPPMAMAVSGSQFSAPQLLLGAKVSSGTAYLVFPSLNIDTSTSSNGAAGNNNPAVIGGAQPSSSGLAGVGDRKALGRASWRLVR
ncbi:MAG: pilus assembly protein [Burkholderiales bacterium]